MGCIITFIDVAPIVAVDVQLWEIQASGELVSFLEAGYHPTTNSVQRTASVQHVELASQVAGSASD